MSKQREPISRYQAVFNAALEAIQVHAPAMEPDRRIQFATSIALRARDHFDGRAEKNHVQEES